jgi:hypothetical protein
MEYYLAKPGDRQAAILARQQRRLGVSWGSRSQSPFWRGFAKRLGWSLPLFGAKKAFIDKMLESDENFEAVVMKSGGIDVWIWYELTD